MLQRGSSCQFCGKPMARVSIIGYSTRRACRCSSISLLGDTMSMNHLNMVLAYCVRRKYKRFHRKPIVKAFSWLQEIAGKDRSLFYHWQRGQTPRLCLCTKSWVWRAVWGETFMHGSVRGWGWNSLALLDPWLYTELWQINESWCKRWHDFGNRKHNWNW